MAKYRVMIKSLFPASPKAAKKAKYRQWGKLFPTEASARKFLKRTVPLGKTDFGTKIYTAKILRKK